MPFPLIPIIFGSAIATALGIGAKKGIGGVGAMKDAQKLGQRAERKHHKAVSTFNSERAALGKKLTDYDELRRETVKVTFGRLIRFLERLNQRSRVQAIEALGPLGVSRESIRQFAAQYVELGGTLSGGVAAVLTGAGASSLATGAVSAFATTAGGAALSGLSGAALNSAMLAWLGGGALAGGGLGMAGGAVILGGIAIGPAVLVGGFVLAAQGEKAKTKAVEFAAEVDRAVAKLEAAGALLRTGQARVDELQDVMAKLDQRATRQLEHLEAHGQAFDTSDDVHLAKFATAMQLAKGLSELVRVQLFTEDGHINTQLETLLSQQRQLVAEASA